MLRRIAAIVLAVFTVVAVSTAVPWSNAEAQSEKLPKFDPARECAAGSIAVLLDTSDSIDSTEMSALKSAAKQLVTSLTGPGSQIGLITFDKTSPSTHNGATDTARSLPASDLKKLIDKIDLLTSINGKTPAEPGTNLAGAIKRAKDLGYESAIIITDGAPTARPSDTTTGTRINKSDVVDAYEAAVAARDGGMSIYTVGIGGQDRGTESFWDDSLNILNPIYPDSGSLVTYSDRASVALYTATNGKSIPGIEAGWAYQYSSQGVNFWIGLQPDETGTYKNKYDGRVKKLFGEWVVVREYDIQNRVIPPRAYGVNVLNSAEFLKGISDSYYSVEDFASLPTFIASKYRACDGLVRVQKVVTDQDAEAAKGFEFMADRALDPNSKDPANPTVIAGFKQTTGTPPVVDFIADNRTKPANITITEIQREGYELAHEDVATCDLYTIASDGTFTLNGTLEPGKQDPKTGDFPAGLPQEGVTFSTSRKASAFTLSNLDVNQRAVCTVENKPTELKVEKEGLGGVSLADKEFSLAYKVTVSNPKESTGERSLAQFVEHPSTIPGTTITSVELSNVVPGYEDEPGTLVTSGSVGLQAQDDGSYTLANVSDLASVPADQSKFAYARVTYRVDDLAKVQSYAQESGTCGSPASESGNGVLNTINYSQFSSTKVGDLRQTTGCTSLEPVKKKALQVSKNAKKDAPVAGVPGTTKPVEYTIAVSNPNELTAAVPALQETPSAPAGTTITSVTVKPAATLGVGQVQLLKASTEEKLTGGGGVYEIPADKLKELAPNTTGVFDVVVSYSIDAADKTSGWTCDVTDGGLRNTVTINDDDSNPRAEACVSLKPAGITVEKSLNGNASTARSKPVIVNPDDDTVAVAYKITNTGEVPVTSLLIDDVALQPNDEATVTKFSQNELTCKGATVNGSTVTLASPLAPTKSLLCSWELPVTEVTASNSALAEFIDNEVLGDQVQVTPTFEGGASDTQFTDNAWMSIQPSFSVNKTATDTQVIVLPDAETVTTKYKVEITNGSAFASAPQALIERPSGDVVSVKVSSSSSCTVPALNESGEVSLVKDPGTGSWGLPKGTELAEIPGGQSACLDVEVTNSLTGMDLSNPQDRAALQCNESDANSGLVNAARVAGSEDSRACTSVGVYEASIAKLIDGQEAQTQEQAVPIMPAATTAEVEYVVHNTGTAPIKRVNVADNYIFGARKDQSFQPAQPLTCTISSATDEVVRAGLTAPAGEVDLGESGLEPGHTLRCTVIASIDELFAAEETIHGNQVSVTTAIDTAGGTLTTNGPVTADAWAERIPALVGTLPDTGGRGIGGFAGAGLAAFLLAGWFMRRNTQGVNR
ncbi:vWA domain-containing protein [Corynebacterium choanae]|uniref:vWA domain-containing protein n=1 Tax=Corynebacterium choanae TaxID=1862358 RepID=UPI000F4F819C|nr:vWA domain-containing protein [Corynebacterium choanae]